MGQGRRIINWTPEIDQTIREMRAGGAVWRVIAERVGGSEWTIILRARTLGLETRKPGRSEDPALIERVRALAAEGMVKYQIAAICGVATDTISNICNRESIETRNGLAPAAPPPAETRAYTNRGEPLPAGHPTSWGAITAGTLLEGVPYR